MTLADALARYARCLETLSPDALDRLAALLHPGVRFADPFHDVTGRAEMLAVFAAMYQSIPDVRFEVLGQGCDVDRTGGFLHWRFSGHLAGLGGRAVDFRGTSVLTSDDAGLVTAHLDYWDAAGGLLQHLPVIGGLLRWLRRRVARPARRASGRPG